MGGFLAPVIEVIILILEAYWYVIIASVIVSWLIAFGVINTYNSTVRTVLDVLYRLTEPVYRPIRQLLPNFGGLDLSPFIVLVILWFVTMIAVAARALQAIRARRRDPTRSSSWVRCEILTGAGRSLMWRFPSSTAARRPAAIALAAGLGEGPGGPPRHMPGLRRFHGGVGTASSR